jgi:hypothetical protein
MPRAEAGSTMRIHPRLAISAVNLIGLAGLVCLVAPARAQAAETITATARVKTSGSVEATAPVTVNLDRFSTDADRDKLLATLKQSGTAGVRALLLTFNPIGMVRVGSQNTVIKYAYPRTTGEGRLITVVTGSPILYVGAGLPGAPPKTGFDLGLLLLVVTTSGPGHGEMVPAAKVKLDQQGAVVADDYSPDMVVQLSNVVGK